jgi:hypothetical protein
VRPEWHPLSGVRLGWRDRVAGAASAPGAPGVGRAAAGIDDPKPPVTTGGFREAEKTTRTARATISGVLGLQFPPQWPHRRKSCQPIGAAVSVSVRRQQYSSRSLRPTRAIPPAARAPLCFRA